LVAVVGLNSSELKQLASILSDNLDDYSRSDMPRGVKYELIHTQKNDGRYRAKAFGAQKDKTDIIVQRYVCHERMYQGHKMDLRILHFLVASVNPLIVLYYDGILRIGSGQHQTTTDHLTVWEGTAVGGGRRHVGFGDWDLELRQFVALLEHRGRISQMVYDNPLQHIRNQLQSAVATLIASVRHVSFTGYIPEERVRNKAYNMENRFAILVGDFIITQDLQVVMTEAQSSPDIGDENSKTQS
jgi:hypothetical protein